MITPVTPAPPRAVTLAVVAARSGVSLTAASKALRGMRPYVSEETIARVQAAAQELGYDPSRHQAARRLAMRRTGTETINHMVGLLLPPIFHETNYHILLFRGVMDVLNPARFGALTCCETGDNLTALPIAFNQGEVDGLIVLGAPDTYHGVISALRRHDGFRQRPIVTLTTPSPGCSSVLLDDQAGGYALGLHLLGLGHRHLLVPEGTAYEAVQRRAGLEQAYTDRGLEPGAYLVEFPWHGDALSGSEAQLQGLLPQHPQVTAIVAANDDNACQIARFLWRHGARIPDDYSLTGFDDCEALLNERGENILTTVRAPLREAGQTAAQLLLDRIAGRAPSDRTVTLPVALVPRASTAPSRSA